MAETVMEEMNLDQEMRRTAISFFQKGKAEDFPLDESLEQFRQRKQIIARSHAEAAS